MRRVNRRRLSFACPAAFLLALGCGGTHPGRPVPTHPGTSITREEIHKLGDSQSYRTRLGAAARQILAPDPGSTSRAVVVVQIDPDTSSYALTPAQIAAGAVIGRFKKLSSGAIRRFGLSVKDTASYWYVYQNPKGQFMGRFVSSNMDTTYAITFEEHKQAEEGLDELVEWKQAIAQFEYRGPLDAPSSERKPRGDGASLALLEEGGGGSVWITCSKMGCCFVQ